MRRLVLMRHAKSSWADPARRDLDRPLNKRGRTASELLGAWLERRGYRPEHALVSSARRAQETWSGVVAASAAAATSYLPELYHAGPDAMLAVLHRAPDVSRLLMLGHQPGIGLFAQRLLAAPPSDAGFAKYPTGATAVIDFRVEAWSDVAWESGKLVDFVVPRSLD